MRALPDGVKALASAGRKIRWSKARSQPRRGRLAGRSQLEQRGKSDALAVNEAKIQVDAAEHSPYVALGNILFRMASQTRVKMALLEAREELDASEESPAMRLNGRRRPFLALQHLFRFARREEHAVAGLLSVAFPNGRQAGGPRVEPLLALGVAKECQLFLGQHASHSSLHFDSRSSHCPKLLQRFCSRKVRVHGGRTYELCALQGGSGRAGSAW